jgi:hypothetical protein
MQVRRARSIQSRRGRANPYGVDRLGGRGVPCVVELPFPNWWSLDRGLHVASAAQVGTAPIPSSRRGAIALSALRLLAVGLSLVQLAIAVTAPVAPERLQATAMTHQFSVDDTPDPTSESVSPPTLTLLPEDTEKVGAAPACGVTEVVSTA